jgi:hypothetical protein
MTDKQALKRLKTVEDAVHAIKQDLANCHADIKNIVTVVNQMQVFCHDVAEAIPMHERMMMIIAKECQTLGICQGIKFEPPPEPSDHQPTKEEPEEALGEGPQGV